MSFSSAYSVTLPHPLSTVFTVLATDIDRVCRLPPDNIDVQILETASVSLPPLASVTSAKDAPVATAAREGERLLTRVKFDVRQSVPVVPGLWNNTSVFHCVQTWSEEEGLVLYEASSKVPLFGVVALRKTRTFVEAKDGEGTLVEEMIEGTCPSLLQSTVQKETIKAHKAHMDMFEKLFEVSA